MTSSAVVIPHSEVHRLRSVHVGADFELWVAQPVHGLFGPPPGAPRVLYVLDANIFFGLAVDVSRIMHQLFGELPPFIVVGVAYPGTDPRIHGETRNRDFTPTSDASFEAMARHMKPDWEPLLPDGQRMGGADRFLACLRDEVRPFIEGRYDVAAEGATLFGCSLAGLFGLYAMLTEPEVFDSYVIGSPAIWWDDEMLLGVEERRAAADRDLRARAFVGVGSLEEDERLPWLARFKTVTNVGRMAERLRARGYASLDIATQVFADETHTSVVSGVLTRGLRNLHAVHRHGLASAVPGARRSPKE